MEAKTLGVGIWGAGWVSGEHIKAYRQNPHTEVRAIGSRRAESARQRAAEAGLACDIYTDLDPLLTRGDIDIISICTPHHLHVHDALATAQAGKHMLLEKPAALSLADLQRVRDAVRQARVKSVVGFVLRWNPFLNIVARMRNDGFFGDLVYAESGYFSHLGPWWPGFEWGKTREQGGELLLVGGVHAVDALRWLAGEVEEVFAYSTRVARTDLEYEPTLTASLRFTGGAVGTLASTFEGFGPYYFPLVLCGTQAVLRQNKLYAAEFDGQTEWVEIPSILPDTAAVSHHPFQGEIDHLVDCILADRESYVNLEDAVKTHEVCFACTISAQEGRPVRLPLLT